MVPTAGNAPNKRSLMRACSHFGSLAKLFCYLQKNQSQVNDKNLLLHALYDAYRVLLNVPTYMLHYSNEVFVVRPLSCVKRLGYFVSQYPALGQGPRGRNRIE